MANNEKIVDVPVNHQGQTTPMTKEGVISSKNGDASEQKPRSVQQLSKPSLANGENAALSSAVLPHSYMDSHTVGQDVDGPVRRPLRGEMHSK